MVEACSYEVVMSSRGEPWIFIFVDREKVFYKYPTETFFSESLAIPCSKSFASRQFHQKKNYLNGSGIKYLSLVYLNN